MRTLFNRFSFVAFLLTGAAFIVASCGKEGTVTEDGHRTEVRFTAGGQTKAAVTAHESDINSLDLLVFRADNGKLDAYNRVSGSTVVSGNLTVGMTAHYYVIANAPEHELDGYTDESDFLSGKTTLGQNGAALLMKGAGTISVVDGSPAVPVTLDRYVSKVSVQSVDVKWYDSFTTPPSFKIGRVALVNVVGDMPWSAVPAVGSVWWNRMNVSHVNDGTPATANVMDMIITPSYDIDVTGSGTIALDKSLYAYPNPTDNDVNSGTNPDWSVRDTRVALEIIIDGVPNWYPVDLPGMRPNRHYVITKMTVLGPGSYTPDIPVSRSEVELEIEVKEWEETETDVDFGLV